MSDFSDASGVIHVDEASFEQEVLRSPFPVLVDVTAAWCPPCRAAAPVVRKLSEKYRGRLKVVEIDGETSAALVARLGVRGFPTFLGVARGEVVARQAGFAGPRSLEALAGQLLTSADAATPLAAERGPS